MPYPRLGIGTWQQASQNDEVAPVETKYIVWSSRYYPAALRQVFAVYLVSGIFSLKRGNRVEAA